MELHCRHAFTGEAGGREQGIEAAGALSVQLSPVQGAGKREMSDSQFLSSRGPQTSGEGRRGTETITVQGGTRAVSPGTFKSQKMLQSNCGIKEGFPKEGASELGPKAR